jgi:CheY-like chemotaxis protein
MRQKNLTSPAGAANACHGARTAIGKYGGGLGGGLKDVSPCDLGTTVVRESIERADVATSAGSRILVVDDNVCVAETVSMSLRYAGFQVTTFYDALPAVQHALTTAPDAVVTDYSMPNMNGLEFAAWLQENCPDCKIVIISGEVSAVLTQPHGTLKFTLLEKPVDPGTLIAAIQ